MSETEKQDVLYALKCIAEAVEEGKLEGFAISYEDKTLFESLKYAPNESEFPR